MINAPRYISPLVPQSVDQGQCLIWSLGLAFDVQKRMHRRNTIRAIFAGINAFKRTRWLRNGNSKSDKAGEHILTHLMKHVCIV